MDFDVVIGLEVHIQLNLRSKVFAPDSATFGAQPNTHVSSLTLGHPGTLPVINKRAIEFAVCLGLACNCEIPEVTYFARKHYFYPDLPKGYQITQDKTPVCRNGFIDIETAEGGKKRILLDHIHLEEDAGKSIHDSNDNYSRIDLNRAGVALMEMVTLPVLSSPEEAHAFLTNVRKLVRFIGICDGNMEEGSMRCDANISLRPKGNEEMGTKVEIKNLNSMRFMLRALHYEIIRQQQLLLNGGTIVQETRSYNSNDNITFSLRDKESAHDYRYFPEPDILPVKITREYIADVRKNMPALPDEVVELYTSKFGLSLNEAHALSENRETIKYFERLIQHTNHYHAAANWIMGPVQSYLNENKIEISDLIVEAPALAKIINMIANGTISHSAAAQKLFPALIDSPLEDPLLLAANLNLLINSDENDLNQYILEVIGKFPEKIVEYKKGRKGLMGLFVGEAMKLSGGKADPILVQRMMKEAIDRHEI